MSTNAISSLIFAYRNVNKTKNGEIGRAPVAAAQGVKVFQKTLDDVCKYNKTIAHGTESAIKAFDKLAESSKVVNYGIKATKWATKNINPMICISSGIKVLTSDDKISTGIKETAAISTMLAGEKAAKMALNHLKIGGKLGVVIKGLLFVAASISSYEVGAHVGKNLAQEVRANCGSKKIDQIA